MKRFYKFLMPLAVIAAMALPARVAAQETCDNGSITVANAEVSNATTSYCPGYSYYNYSVSEVLVPAAALEGLGEIHSMQFKPAVTTAGSYFTNCEVYLANSVLSDLSDGWVQDSTLQLVYTGDLSYTDTSWQTITFDSVFNYTGGSLIVLVRRNHGSYSSGSSFQAYSADAILARYIYQDSGPYTIGSISGGYTSSNAPLYKFTGCYIPVTCARITHLVASDPIPTGVTLSWVDTLNSGATYTVINMADSSVLATSITNTTVDLTGLTPSTTYTFGVYAECGGGDVSGTNFVTVTTLPPCPTPTNLVVDTLTTDEITVSWTAGYQETDWELSINDSIISVSSSPHTFTDLEFNSPYVIMVRALCSADDTSAWTAPLNTRTLAGEPISEFPYYCGFEINEEGTNEAAPWVMEAVAGNNNWYADSALSNGGSRSLYVSNDGGVTNAYDGSSASVAYAYASFMMEAGEYAFSFDWKCYGESSWDFLRVAYAPYGTELVSNYSSWVSGAGAPDGFTAVDGGKLNQIDSWQNFSGTFTITNSGVYNFYFVWRNDGSVTNYSPAAIDNFQLVRNSCPQVQNLEASYVSTDSITIVWNSGSTETTWMVSNGVDEPVEVNDSTYTFEDLTPNTVYNLRVQAACGSEDSSMWSSLQVRTACALLTAEYLPMVEDFESQATTSSNSTTFIPCWHHLNDGTYPGYPYISGSSSYNHTEEGTKGLYWYYYNTTTYGTRQIVVLPGVDTNDVEINTLRLSFWAKNASTSYQPVLYVGVMTDPEADSTFQYYDTIQIDHSSTNWAKYTVLFNNFEGNGQYVAIRANLPSSYWTVYVDDITLDLIPACPSVEDIEVVTSPTSAIASWNTFGNSYTGAVVEYKATDEENWTSVTVSGNNYVALTGLNALTVYDLRVSAICGDAEGMPVSTQFATGGFGCAVMDASTSHFDTVTGTPTTSYQRPVNNFYNNTFSEQIYDSTELAGSGPIVSFSLNYAHTSPMTKKNNVMVYMGNTTLSTISTTNYMMPSAMTLVYNGSLNCVDGWNEFQLDVPFNYTGGNLAVAFVDNSGQYDGSAYVWNGHSAAGKSFSWYSDSYTYPNSGMSTNTTDFRPDMAFSFIDCITQSTCAAPVAYVANVATNSVQVVWAPGNTETSWNLYYRMAGDASWTSAATAVTATNYTFSGLVAGRPYEFKVENVCGTETLSTTVDATTQCASISLPFFEDFNGWGVGTGVLPQCWYRTGSYSSYTYINSAQNMTGSTGGSVYMYCSGSYNSWLILPELDSLDHSANQAQLVFNVKYTSDSYGAPTFVVGVMDNPEDIESFVEIDTVSVESGINEWEVFEVPLAAYTGTGRHVALHTIDPGTYFYCYVDDISLEEIPSCLRPDSLTAENATTTTVDLGWHDRSGASSWIVEYGPRGFQLGTGTVVPAPTNPFTLTGLPVAFQGEYYVKAVCSSASTGEYSRRPCAFGTTQIPATLPYNYDFEAATEWNNWQTSSNSMTTDWVRGDAVADSGSYSMYVSPDGSSYFNYGFNAVINAAAYRDIDFGTIDSSYTLSFRARVGGTTTASYDGMMVFLVDPAIATVASQSNITSPWGNVNNLYRIATVRLDTNWNTYTASFDTISGVHRVAFFWFNQNTGGSYTNIPQPAAVDNIHIDYSSCPRPVSLEALNVGASTAQLTWRGASDGTYQVTYRKGSQANQNAIANTNHITLTGLDANSEYRVWVRKICGEGDTSLYSDGTSFFTSMCEGGEMYPSYDASDAVYSSGSGYGPIGYSLYNYSYTQTIIDSATMAQFAGDITAFGFMPLDDNGADDFQNIDVYMANVPESSLTSGFIHPDATHTFVQVIYNGDFNFTASDVDNWIYHSFDTVFHWDGHSNVLFAVNRRNGSWSSTTYFAAHTRTGDKMRYLYNDNDAYDITTVSGGTTTTTVGDIMLVSCGGTIVCNDPVIVSAVATETEATITFSGESSSYEVAIVEGAWVEPIAGTPIADTFYTFTGLTGNTTYAIGVRGVCGSAFSDWAYQSITTERHPCVAPTGLTVSNVTITGATLTWTVGEEGQTDFEVNVTGNNFDETFTATGTSYTVSGLNANGEYSATVRAVCDEGYYSDWSTPATFTTVACVRPSQPTAGSITANGATITWPATSNSNGSYILEYGIAGFNYGSGTSVTVNGTSYTITGLDAEYVCDVYVRSVCDEGVYSDWSPVCTFTTASGEGTYYTVTVTVNDPAMGHVEGAPTQPVEAGTVLTLTAVANDGYHFVNWNDGQTTASITFAVNGNMTVTANFAQNSGIDDVDATSVSVYPNPASSDVTVKVGQPSEVMVIDMQGRTVVPATSVNSSLIIPHSSLPAGTYFLRITGEQTTLVRKLIVQ